ncbi:MAG: ABC transporter substrate-binding protein [Alphaproteobacteria bacterium]|nr:ABC transporter substrate-binding protein [Alphaproteobacteria bacterium]
MSRVLRTVILVVALALGGAAKANTPEEAAVKFVRELAEEAIAVLGKDKSLDELARERQFRRLMLHGFDIPLIGRFVLGVNWREASEEERKEYLALFEDYLVRTYSKRLSGYKDEVLEVNGAKPLEKELVVASLIKRSDGPPIRVDWQVRTVEGKHRIVDVIVEGASMRISQRSEFASVIQSGKGKLASLLAMMRERTAGMR